MGSFEANTLNTSDSQNVNLGRGKIYVGNLDATTGLVDGDGLCDLGNVTNFSLQVATERVQRNNFRACTVVQDLDLVTTQNVGVSMTLDELTAENLARFLAGQSTNAGYTSPLTTAITDQTIGNAVTGVDLYKWYELRSAANGPLFGAVAGDISLEAGAAAGFASGTGTALTLGTDYELDLDHSLVRFLNSATMAANPHILFDLAAAAATQTFDTVEALSSSVFNGWVKFLGCNGNGDQRFQLDLFKVLLAADGELQMIGNEFSEMTFAGSANSNAAAQTSLSSASDIGRFYDLSAN